MPGREIYTLRCIFIRKRLREIRSSGQETGFMKHLEHNLELLSELPILLFSCSLREGHKTYNPHRLNVTLEWNQLGATAAESLFVSFSPFALRAALDARKLIKTSVHELWNARINDLTFSPLSWICHLISYRNLHLFLFLQPAQAIQIKTKRL